jgi:hypothetical protein
VNSRQGEVSSQASGISAQPLCENRNAGHSAEKNNSGVSSKQYLEEK